jgi:hypothetical protein
MLSKIDENDSEAKRISLRPFLEGCEIEEAILEDTLYLQLRITTDPPSPISSLYVAGERGVVVKGSSRSWSSIVTSTPSSHLASSPSVSSVLPPTDFASSPTFGPYSSLVILLPGRPEVSDELIEGFVLFDQRRDNEHRPQPKHRMISNN